MEPNQTTLSHLYAVLREDALSYVDPMLEDLTRHQMRYEFKTVHAIRGTERRSIAKWESEGWQLATQERGTLRTELRFQRPKKHVNRMVLVAGAGLFVIVVVGIIIGAIIGGADPAATSADPAATTTADPTRDDTEEENAETEDAAAGNDVPAVDEATDKQRRSRSRLGRR